MFKNLKLNPSNILNNDYPGQDLKHTVVRGSMAQVLAQGMSFGLSIINTMILARLLTPSDFGIVGMVTVFINFLVMFKDAGLSTATIQNENITYHQISTLFWINTLISTGLGIIILISSPLIALFYHKPELTSITIVLSFSFIIQGLTIQHSALLQRHLKFTTLAINDIIAQICLMAVAIAMAALGFDYWAIVGGTIARTVTLVALTYLCCPWIPGKMKKGSGVRSMLKFGGNLTASNFIGYLSRNLDKLLIGRFVGAEPLGLYTRSFTLLMTPLTQIRAPLTTMALPVLSSLKSEPMRYQSYFRQLLDISVSLTLPISIYCFLESEFLIEILLGQKWMDAVPIFKTLSVAGIFIAMSAAPGAVMLSYGFSKRYLHITIITSTIVTTSFITGIPFGIKGVATAYTIANCINMVPLIGFSFRKTPIKLQLVLESLGKPLLTALIAGLSTYVFIISCKNETTIKHVLIGLIFFIIYAGITLLRPETRNTLHSILKSIVQKKR